MSETLLEIKNLTQRFNVSKPWLNRVIEREEKKFLTAVNDVSFNQPMENEEEGSDMSLNLNSQDL